SEASASSTSSSSTSRLVSWRPKPLAFHPFRQSMDPQPLRVLVRRPLVARLTKDIVETFQICNPRFHYSEEFNPKNYLTSPSVGVLNNGCDNANADLILSINYSLVNPMTNQRYIVKDMLGRGTFGQVAKCLVAEKKTHVAVKIIKNLPAYYQQALVEVNILNTLNKKLDPEDKHHIVRIYDFFKYKEHLCIVFEMLDTNLYELIKLNHFRGLSLSIVQLFSKQMLHGLALMKKAGIIHCDLKPENILLCRSAAPAEIKIIDFGSACMEGHTIYSYIQSRYYRSPEVLLGYQYNTAIDMWSFGCVVAELFLGLPLFPGASEFDLLRRMIQILRSQPPDHILRKAKNTSKFFKFIGSIDQGGDPDIRSDDCSKYCALTEEEFSTRESRKPDIGKEYFNDMTLGEVVTKYPYRRNLVDGEIARESNMRLALIDFLRGLLEFDPIKRWSPIQASKHPFVTGEPFMHPYIPTEEPLQVPVPQNFRVDHHPAGGYWFAAGLSPNVSGLNRTLMPSGSPHYQLRYMHPGSYGSMGSSYGSYGDGNNFHAFYSPSGPSCMNVYGQSGTSFLGNSPDTRRMMPFPHSNGIGFSPGNFVHMSPGSSPLQFTPPSSFSQISPGQYGPASPARGGNCQGSPLGKLASGSQYTRRQQNSSYQAANFQFQDSSVPCHQGQAVGDFIACRPPEGNSSSHGNQSALSRRSQCGRNVTSGFSSSSSSSHAKTLHRAGCEDSEVGNHLPDPADWDPNYSEELLLQEDTGEASSLSNEFQGMHLCGSQVNNEP
ncbi:hypothetical protein M569_07524, partial [Genlisea aurea]